MQKFDAVWLELQAAFLGLEQERLEIPKKRRKAKKNFLLSLFFLYPLLLLLVTGLFYLNYGTDEFPMPTVFAALALPPFLWSLTFYQYTEAKKLWKHNYKASFFVPLARAMQWNLQYKLNGHLSEEEFLQSSLYPQYTGGRVSGEDHISGTYGKTSLRFSEFHAEQEFGGNYKTVFKGLFFAADANKHFAGETFIFHRSRDRGSLRIIRQKKSKEYQEIKLENPEFSQHFLVYASDPIEARYLLTPDFMERLLALRKYSERISASFVEGHLYISLVGADKYFEVDIEQSLLEPASLQGFYEELKSLLELVEVLDLNTRIWSKD